MTWILPWKNVEILEVKDYNGGEMKDNTRLSYIVGLSNIYKIIRIVLALTFCRISRFLF